MANGEKRDVKPSLLKGLINGIKAALSDRMDVPANNEPGALVDRRLSEQFEHDDDRRVVRFQPHLRKWFDELSEDDVGRLKKLLELRPQTVEWIEAKNPRELKSLDGAVEFISSSRTAGKVLLWVLGTSVTVVGGVIALAKYGIDAVAFLRARP